MFFSWLDWINGFWGGKPHQPKIHDLSLFMLILITCLRFSLSGFSKIKLLFSPVFILDSLEVIMHSPHLGVEHNSYPFVGGGPTKIIWNSSVWEICLLSDWFIQLFIYIGMDLWIFILHTAYGLISHCPNCSSSGHWVLYQLVPVPLWHIPIIVVNTSLFFGTTRCSRLTLNLSCPNPIINDLFNKPWFVYWRILETHIQGLGWTSGFVILMCNKVGELQAKLTMVLNPYYT